MICPICKGRDFRHMHDTAHGLPGTHMAGSERFECVDPNCGMQVRPVHRLPGFTFVFDALPSPARRNANG